jgi:hypothetical protein
MSMHIVYIFNLVLLVDLFYCVSLYEVHLWVLDSFFKYCGTTSYIIYEFSLVTYIIYLVHGYAAVCRLEG